MERSRSVEVIQDEELELDSVIRPPCLAEGGALCLNDWRFLVEAEWADFEGVRGAAQGHLTGDDSGVFWLFGPSNAELQVKVLMWIQRTYRADRRLSYFWRIGAGFGLRF